CPCPLLRPTAVRSAGLAGVFPAVRGPPPRYREAPPELGRRRSGEPRPLRSAPHPPALPGDEGAALPGRARRRRRRRGRAPSAAARDHWVICAAGALRDSST